MVRDNAETLYAATAESGAELPRFVRAELEGYLGCGLLCRGFAHLRCEGCSERRLVAFSCKGRGFCPSCMGRRMAETAANLMESVLPEGGEEEVTVDPLDTLFHHLDTWRHLPNYQLERRADVLFSIYLRGMLEEFTGTEIESEIIPEFPLKRDLIWPELPTNKSVKVDYVLFAKKRSRVYFVELKTDDASRRDAQDTYLQKAKELGFRKIVEGVRAILLSTTAHQKYHHLSTALARLGHLTLPPDLPSYIHPLPREGLVARLAEIAVTTDDTPIEVIYLQPTRPDPEPEGERYIDFEMFAKHVENTFDDVLSRKFVQHLRLWQEPAGSRAPKA